LARTTFVCAHAGAAANVKIKKSASTGNELRVFMKTPLELIRLSRARKSLFDRLAQTIRPELHQHRTVYENSRRAFYAVRFTLFNVPANVFVNPATCQVGVKTFPLKPGLRRLFL